MEKCVYEFDCPYAKCRWPACYSGDEWQTHPLCATAVVHKEREAMREVTIKPKRPTARKA